MCLFLSLSLLRARVKGRAHGPDSAMRSSPQPRPKGGMRASLPLTPTPPFCASLSVPLFARRAVPSVAASTCMLKHASRSAFWGPATARSEGEAGRTPWGQERRDTCTQDEPRQQFGLREPKQPFISEKRRGSTSGDDHTAAGWRERWGGGERERCECGDRGRGDGGRGAHRLLLRRERRRQVPGFLCVLHTHTHTHTCLLQPGVWGPNPQATQIMSYRHANNVVQAAREGC